MAQPTQRTIRIGQSSPAAGNTICRAKQLLSPINHRLYREGRTYVQKVDLDANSTQVVEVYALADTWMVHKAWKLAYDTYMLNTQEERAIAGKNAARWADFSIGCTVTGFGAAKPIQFDGLTLASTIYTAGEFPLSEVSLDNGTDYTFSWTATSGSTFNVIGEYDLAGRTQGSPEDSETVMPYQALNTDDLDSTIYRHVQEDGDFPPYNPDSLGGTTPLVHIATLNAQQSINAQKLSTGFFRAPCGIVLLKGYAPVDDASQDVSITYKAGSYKGVDAPSMLE
jgi:hypothetical protein